MRSFAAVALFAGAALAQGEYTETAYSTQEVTITSCGPEVTNCPASSTATPVYTPPVYTPPTVSSSSSSVYSPVSSSSSVYTPPVYTSPSAPVYSSPSAPVYSSPSAPVYSSPVYSSPVYSSPVPPVSSPVGSCPPAVTSTVTVTVPSGGVSSSVYGPTASVPAPYPTGSAPGGGSASPTGSYPTSYPTTSSPPINAGGKTQAGVVVAALGAVAAFFL